MAPSYCSSLPANYTLYERKHFLFPHTFGLHRRNDQILFERLAVELRDDLDLLAAREEIAKGHTGDTCHLNVVDDAHELVQQSAVLNG